MPSLKGSDSRRRCPFLQVYLSTRSGAWVIRQVSDSGQPVDRFNTRFVHVMFKLLPMCFLNWLGEKKLNSMYDHAMYGLKPKHRCDVTSASPPTVPRGIFDLQ